MKETIRVTSPKGESVTIEAVEADERIHGDGWLLTVAQALLVAELWKNGPIDKSLSDTIRHVHYTEIGFYLLILVDDGYVTVDEWESAEGALGDDLYSTHTMPLDDYTIEVIPA